MNDLQSKCSVLRNTKIASLKNSSTHFFTRGRLSIFCASTLFFLSLFSCGSNSGKSESAATDAMVVSGESGRFQLLTAAQSGIDFVNNLQEDVEQNYLNFEYIYNGGGVAIGDVNNDGLPDIYFSGNEVENKLYLNKGSLKFEDVTQTAGVAADDGWYTGVSMVDINNDGWLDIYLCRSDWRKQGSTERRNKLYINQRDGSFKDEATAYGLAENGYSIQSTFFDYDNDGDLDAYITNHPNEYGSPVKNRDQKVQNPPEMMRDKLYRNNGNNTFTEVSRQAGILNYAHGLGIVSADVNQDGWIDIYVTNDYEEPDFLYLNQKDGTFRESLQEITGHISLFAMGVDIADINNDGLPDIMTTEMLPESYKRSKTNMASMNPERFVEMAQTGMHHQYMHNSLQLNRDNRYFSEISQLAGISKTDWSWACLISDYDNDGLKDIFIANGYKRDVFDKDFAKESAKIIAKNNGTIPIFDIYEIMPSTKLINYLYQNNGDLTFSKKSREWGLDQETLTQGAATADLDLDGDLDLVLNNLDDLAMIYENQSSNNNNRYLRIRLEGKGQNRLGLGAKVNVFANGVEQYQEMIMVRGYQSSSEPVLHFGVGTADVISQVQVTWLDGTVTIVNDVATNQVISIDQESAGPVTANNDAATQALFTEDSQVLLNQPFVHRENIHDDYAVQVLLPHKLSQLGPFTTVGDVNGDGMEDFFVGGAKGQAGKIYLQQKGGFSQKSIPALEADKGQEDMDALFFDADQDGDLDLYVVSGGTELAAKLPYYQDRLYLNNGKGGFSKSTALPEILASGSCVTASDFDQDGDLDLFVGGRVIPNLYPYSTQSYLFRNDGGTFVDVGISFGRDFALQGMVTSALWTDIDNDGWDDLITTGEWMPIRIFRNQNGSALVEMTQQYGLQNTAGWWNKIIATDYDKDGDMDFVVGNLGLNYKFHARAEKPFHIYTSDFDGNQTMDVVLAKYDGNNEVPVRGRQCSSEQMPFIEQKFPTYNDFANASVNDMLGDGKEKALHLQAKMFESIVLENTGGGFLIKPLPVEAQVSAVHGIISEDFNQDGYTDLLLAGNMYGSEPETSRADASIGLVLLGNADKTFTPLSTSASGVLLPYDVKSLQQVKLAAGQPAVLVTCNNDALRILRKTQ